MVLSRAWGWSRQGGWGAAAAETRGDSAPPGWGRGAAAGRSISSAYSPLVGHSTAPQIRGMQCRSWWKESDLNNAVENSAARLAFIILFFQ